MTELTDWTKRGMAQRPIEAEIVSRLFDDLAEAGTPIVSVEDPDGGDDIATPTKEDFLNWVFNLDEITAYTAESFVYLVMGQDWDTLVDYGVSLEPGMKNLNAYIERGMVGSP